MYTFGSSAECVFPQPIVRAQLSTPLAGCIYQDSFCLGDDSSDDDNSDHKLIHLFYISETGVMADQIITISPNSLTKFDGGPITPWTPGTIHELELEIPLATKFAASCSDNNEFAIVVVFERPSLSSSSHIFEAMRQRHEPWKVLPRPNHYLEGVRGAPLQVTHLGDDSANFSILYQSATTSSLSLCLADPDLERPYVIRAEVMPSRPCPKGSPT
jgi:hypothetical protein